MKIDKKILEALQGLASKRELDFEALKAEFIETFNKLSAQGVKNPQIIAKNMLFAQHREFKPYRRKRKYRMGHFTGFKIGDTGMVDDAARMRQWAEYIIGSKGVDFAKQQGLVQELEDKIVVLDTRAKIFGRPNKNKGKPLSPTLKLRRRDLLFLAKEAKDSEFKFTRLQTKDNRLALGWSQVPFYTPLTFPASVQQENGGYLLGSSSAKDSLTVFQELKEEWDIYKEYTKWAEREVTPIQDVFKFYQATKDAWDRWIMVKGIVTSIGLDNETYRGIPCVLIDSEAGYEAEKSVLFYMPEHLKINFGPYSEIYLLGKTMPIRDVEEETKKKVEVGALILAWGVMPMPGRTTDAKASLLERGSEEEEEIQCFIPAE